MKKHNARINIPVKPSPLVVLAVAIKAQHEKLGKNSPLNVLDWEKYGPAVDEASEVNTKVTGLEKDVEKLSERRQVLVNGSLIDFVRSSRDVLTGAFRGQLHQMVNFGFDVSNTPVTKKASDAAEKKVA
jgi:hypothetical protein